MLPSEVEALLCSQERRSELPIPLERFYASRDLDLARGDVFHDIPFARLEEVSEQICSSEVSLGSYGSESQVVYSLAANTPNREPLVKLVEHRVVAVCVTPTCDIKGAVSLSFIPLEPLDGISEDELQRDTLFSSSGGYDELMGFYDPSEGLLGECFVQFANIFPVGTTVLGDLKAKKLKSLEIEAHDLLVTKLARYFGKSWGYSATERVEVDGVYGCVICRRHAGLMPTEVNLRRGDLPPNCEDCQSARRQASWRILLPHKVRKIRAV